MAVLLDPWLSRGVAAGDGRADYERREREHRSEDRECDRRRSPGPEAAIEAPEEGDRRDKPDRGKQDPPGRSGEKRSTRQGTHVMEYMGEKADEAAPHREHRAPDTPAERGGLDRDAGHALLTRSRSPITMGALRT